MSLDFEGYAEVLKGLGHPVRLKICAGLILKKECNVKNMVNELKLPQSTVSQHLAFLKARGIVKQKRDGVRNCYFIVNNKVKEIIKILKK